MNLTSAPQVRALLAEHGVRPKKRLGQNFLIDRNVLNRILSAADLTPESKVLEIGPGLGVVTVEAARRARKVVCVEIDPSVGQILREVLSRCDCGNVVVVVQDFLKFDLADILESNGQWVVIANLPYYITTPILTRLIDSKRYFSAMLLMVQREVAQRLRAEPGSDDYGAISVFVQYHCKIESIMRVSRNVFYPVPEVDSELIKLTVRDVPPIAVSDELLFFSIVRAAFGKRRKTLLNALSSSPELKWDRKKVHAVLAAAGIDPGRRGETLTLAEFAALAEGAMRDFSFRESHLTSENGG